MTTYYVDLGDGERVEVEASFTALCGEEPDGSDAWTYTVMIEVVEQVHVRRSR